MKAFILLIFSVFLCGQVIARDLFQGGGSGGIKHGDALVDRDVIYGYRFLIKDFSWKFEDSLVRYATGFQKRPIGTLRMYQISDGVVNAVQAVTVNLDSTNSVSGWYGVQECEPQHLFSLAHGNSDCIAIDQQNIQIDGKNVPMLVVKNFAANGSNFYLNELGISLQALGFSDTGSDAWTESRVKSDPNKSEFLGRVVIWAKKFQLKVFYFAKTGGVMGDLKDVDSWMSWNATR